MDQLPYPPRTFNDFIEADLRRAVRLIIKTQAELDWQFRFATRSGDHAIAVTMPGDPARQLVLDHIRTLFLWKQATMFTVSLELLQPDAVAVIGVSRNDRLGCLTRVRRTPRPWTAANFGPLEWLGSSSIDPAFSSLLPLGYQPMTPQSISALQPWFGIEGKFPVVHIETGAIRGI